MKKWTLTLGIFLFAATVLAGAQATVLTARGRVSIRQNGRWARAYTGMRLNAGAVISTGYGSAALLRITPGWTMVRVNQFTTVSISRLAHNKQTVSTGLKLRMGTIRAVVRSSSTLKSRRSPPLRCAAPFRRSATSPAAAPASPICRAPGM